MDLYHSLRNVYRNKSVWILNDTTVKALRKLKDNNGNYIWQPSVQLGQPDMINDMYVESRNDDYKYPVLATQEDMNRF